MLSVLLVDDEEIFLNFMQHIIPWEQYGCTIAATATSGEEAIAQISALVPDIVFCDINMASVSGLDVCAYTKAEGLPCKMIITTAHDSFTYARQAIALNVFEYLLKPFDQAELLAILNRCTAQIEKQKQEQHQSKERKLLALLRAGENAPPSDLLLPTEKYTVSLLRIEKGEQFDREVVELLLSTHCGKVQNYILGQEKEYVILLQIYNISITEIVLQAQFSALLEDFHAVMFCKIAIGSTHNTLRALKTSYDNAIIAYENSIRITEEIVTYEQTLHHYEHGAFYSKDDIDLLIASLAQMEHETIDHFITEIFGLSAKHIFSFQYVMSTYHMVYLHILYHFHLNPTETGHYLRLQKNMMHALDQCRSATEVHALLKNGFIDIFTECNSAEAVDKKAQLTQRLDKYLQDHFHESDLTINRIAEDLFYENSYIRKIYKEKTGKTISQALEELRIAHAKELLHADYLQSDIAEQCGFSNQFYFSKRFKQICGCSPSAYKAQRQ